MELYTKNRAQADDTGLALVPKLKYEHVHLTSYYKMRVDFAAQVRMIGVPFSTQMVSIINVPVPMYIQVLSSSIAKGLTLCVGAKATQTAHFADMFDKFF